MHFPMHLIFRTAPCKNNMPPTKIVHGGVVVMHGNRFCVYAFSKKNRCLKKEKCINCFLVVALFLCEDLVINLVNYEKSVYANSAPDKRVI